MRSIITTRTRSLGQGNVFTSVCHSLDRGGVSHYAPVYTPPADTPPPETATEVGGRHLTGMHSCCYMQPNDFHLFYAKLENVLM